MPDSIVISTPATAVESVATPAPPVVRQGATPPRPLRAYEHDSLLTGPLDRHAANTLDSRLDTTLISLRRIEERPDTVVTAPAPDTVATTSRSSLWRTGMEATPRPHSGANDSTLVPVIVAMFLIVLLSFRQFPNMLPKLFHEMSNTRTRDSVFEEHTTNERTVQTLLALQLCMSMGLLLYALGYSELLRTASPAPFSMGKALCLMAVWGGLYALQLAGYALTGYVFASSEVKSMLVQGFVATQSLISLAMVVPAMVATFYPPLATPALALAAAIYIGFKTVFIIKGFRIFYDNLLSWVYFILYLCTLEIVPISITIVLTQYILTV